MQDLINHLDTRAVARAAVAMALSDSREEERSLKQSYAQNKIFCAAVDCGGDFVTAVPRVVERAVVAAKREKLISDTHLEEGAVAGAAHEALSQIMNKALGLNFGGKVGLARCGEHMVVCVFFGVGLMHLNEVALALGHRVL